jgi:PKD repeat protein
VPGDVIVTGITPLTPNGLLRKVAAIQISGESVIITTSTATLEDAIAQGAIDVSKILTPDDVSSMSFIASLSDEISRLSSQALGQKFYLEIPNIVIYDADGKTSTTFDQARINGVITFDPSFEFKIEIKEFRLRSLLFTNTIALKTQVELISEISIPLEEKKIDIAEYYFNPIVIMIGLVPVVIIPKLTVSVGLEGNSFASVTSSASYQITFTSGLSFKNKRWESIRSHSENFEVNAPSLSAGAAIKPYISIQPELLLYGVVGPHAEGIGYLRLDADIFSNPWWRLYGGLEANVGVEVEILSRVVAGYKATVIEYEKLLKQAEGPFPIANNPPTATILSPSNNSTFTQGDPITFRGSAADPEDGRLSGSSLVWRSSRDGVIGTGESFTKSDLSIGTHTITLTATDSKGAIGQDSILITINKRPNRPPVAVIRASPTTGEAPLTVSFDASQSYDPDGRIASYNWNFGDGTTGTGIVISHTYSSAGTFNASLAVTDDEGATGADSITITVSPYKIIPTSLTINLDPSSIPENTGMNIKISGRLTRRDTGQGIGGKQIGVVFHTITMIRGAITDSNGYYQTEYPVPGVLPAGSYEFVAYFEGDSQYARSEARAFLTINPTANIPPVAVINASPTIGNAPLTVNFDGSSSYDPDGHIISYEWSFGDRTFGSGAIVSHTYNDSSPYPYTAILTVTDDKGATGSSSVTIYVTSAPSRRANIVIRASPNPVSIFPNNSEQVIYYFQETNGVSATINSRVWEWVFIDGTSCCSGAAVNVVHIEGFSSTTWSDSIYLPEDIAWRAYEKGEPYRVILRTTFHALDGNGNSFDITFDLLVDIIIL